VFFILLSSILHSAALWQFYALSDDHSSASIVEEVPDTLFQSAASHLQILQLLCRQGSRFGIELVQTVHAILSLLCGAEGLAVSALGDELFTLSHYRWRGSGSGIIKLTEARGACEWNHGGVDWHRPLSMASAAVSNDTEPRRQVIRAICDPAARVCMQGYFDLSISVALTRSSSSDLQDGPQGRCYPLGFTLAGTDNQSFRRRESCLPGLHCVEVFAMLNLLVIRRCHIAFEAINGQESPILQLILPYVLGWPTILHGMLALSINASKRTSREFDYHQAALSELRTEIGRLYNGVLDTAGIHKILCSSFLLAMFSLADCDGCWAHHVRGMVNIIRMSDRGSWHSSKLGTFLISACAHQDISAFAVGRVQPSKRCWLAWMSQRGEEAEDVFSPFEIMVGYPESLIGIIARISEATEDEISFRLQGQQYQEQISVFAPGKYL
jgi:hypothetical protein